MQSKKVFWGMAILILAGALFWLFLLSAPEAAAPVETTDAPDTVGTAPVAGEPAVDYVGLSEAAAETLAVENAVPFRVVERDGEMLPTTRDYRPGRINATVEAGVVTSYLVEGELEPVSDGGKKQGDPDANKYDFGDPVSPDVDGVTATGEHDEIIGMTEAEAEAYAEANEVPFRIGSVDGEPRPLTMDYRPGRITASVEDGVVTEYTVEGEPSASAPGGEHDDIIGMTEAEAIAYAEARDVPFRIGSIDGEALMLTEDYIVGRITASLEDGIVTDYSVE
jgi:hypothetical protein